MKKKDAVTRGRGEGIKGGRTFLSASRRGRGEARKVGRTFLSASKRGRGEGEMITKKKPSSTAILKAGRGDFYESVAGILRAARTKAHRAVNFAMVEAYWTIGRMIVEEEQAGKERAEYGKALLRNLSLHLTKEFGKGFTETNLKYFRQFYLAFPILHAVRGKSAAANPISSNKLAIRHALSDQLTWTHYRLLLRVEKPAAREWYMTEAAEQNWSTRALERQIHSFYPARNLAGSRN